MGRHLKVDNTPINTLIKNIKDKKEDIEIFQKSLLELRRRFDYLDLKDQKRIIQVLPKFEKKNTPIATLIKDFSNKRSRKVLISRSELLERYEYLDWSDQKRVIKAFLLSACRDRLWAYDELLVNWDNSFESIIMDLWEQYHETVCSWVIMRHFPKEFVIRNIDSFDGKRDYFFICKRFAADEDFIVDKTRLSNLDYLSLFYHTKRTINPNEAHDLLYHIVHDLCLGPINNIILDKYAFRYNMFNIPAKGDIVCPNQFREVSIALYYLKMLNCDDIVEEFNIWNQKVKRMILESLELKNVNQNLLRLANLQYEKTIIQIARKYTYIALEDKYKELDMPVIKQKNDSLKQWDIKQLAPPDDFFDYDKKSEEVPF